MAHYSLVVVGLNVHEQMNPFLIHKDSEPYPMYLQEFEIIKIEKEYNVDRDNIATFIQCLSDFMRLDAGFNDDGFFYTSTLNPNGKWKSYEIGGRWQGILSLKDHLLTDDILNLRKIEERLKNGIIIRNPEQIFEDSQLQKPADNNNLTRFSSLARKVDIDFSRVEMNYSPKFQNYIYGNFLPYAFLRDYHWYDKGRLGVHAYPGEVEKTDLAWLEEWTWLMDDVENEEYLTIVDCEI
ncbi:hypothetical protein [Leptospira sp. GIMC2001]|uniref:hypothetical protein n=1 Tax=Leptospira sp. GIMC2001 TaxID=1513297 RepID=UPI00234A8B84|nr:hypothetical protein [Leptospira sp. GIMC2001]WCL48565.1 hypothetical protein O4O04_14820 [Leptospira sp. GIMC2001]